MASPRHQRLARLLAEHPEALVAALERLLGLDLPGEIELLQGPETVRPGGGHDYLADGTALLARVAPSEEREAIVIEIQLGEDKRKHRSWPLYLAGVHNRLGCPVLLVVITDSERIARWASQPIDLGRGCLVIRPWVLGPRQIPRDVAPEQSQNVPVLAVLSVVAHGRGDGGLRIARQAVDAVRPLIERGDEIGMLYLDVITAFVDEAVLLELSEDEMNWASLEPVSEFGKRHRRQGREEGRKEGLEHALLTVLESRGLGVAGDTRQRVASCSSEAILDTWLQRAARASRLDEVFTD